MIIREFLKTDADKIQNFFDVMGEESASFFNVNHGNERRCMRFFSEDDDNIRFFLAEDNAQCSALIFIWDLNKSVPWFGIAVRDELHGQGIGSKMIEYAVGFLKENGYGGLLLTTAVTNIKAQRLYEKCGFEKIGTHPSGEYLYILRFDV